MNITPYDIIDRFEKTIAEYTGSPFAVAIDSCTNALFLCCVYYRLHYGGSPITIKIPNRTYPGVACAIINSGNKLAFSGLNSWENFYSLTPTTIIDSALYFDKDMYKFGTLMCLSFHIKKHIPIGRGGMILCSDKLAYNWFKKARFDGREPCPLKDDPLNMIGYNMYLTPPQAARGLMLFDLIKNKELAPINMQEQCYPDLSKIKTYQQKD